MAILQIKGIDDAFYARLKQVAAEDNRSVSQEVLHLTKEYLARMEGQAAEKTPARALLALAGSWDDERSAEDIVRDLRTARRNAGASPAL